MLIYLLYKFGQFLSLALPRRIMYRIAGACGILKYYFSPRDGRSVISNLKVILDKPVSKKELKRMARAVFINFAKYLVDFFHFAKVRGDDVDKVIKICGRENLDETLKRGKGIIIVAAHMGNWELGGMITALKGYPLNVIVLSHKNERINNMFVKQRTRTGVRVIPLGRAVRRIFEVLKQNEMVALLGDRDFTKRGIKVEFLGKEVQIPKGPATVSLKSGAPIICAFVIRKKDNSYTITFEKPIETTLTGHTEADLKIITRAFVTRIEGYIRRYPEQWYMFRRFWSSDANVV